jgi:hypothetical protein
MKGTGIQSWIKNAGFEKAETLLFCSGKQPQVMLTPIG